ncbi:hypothetical protein [Brevundimonas sp.]|uniref:hypothetical protein n=1 Tax=Brevundimonas sp. TaxID=1871086 RepID=UPI0035B26F42
MSYNPLDFERFCRKIGHEEVRRALLNGEFDGVDSKRAEVFLQSESKVDWISRVGVIASLVIAVVEVAHRILNG